MQKPDPPSGSFATHFYQKHKDSDYYSILGVEGSASENEIRKMYREKSLLLHPDKNKGTDTTASFLLLNNAFRTLSNPALRASYDRSKKRKSQQAAERQQRPRLEGDETFVAFETGQHLRDRSVDDQLKATATNQKPTQR